MGVALKDSEKSEVNVDGNVLVEEGSTSKKPKRKNKGNLRDAKAQKGLHDLISLKISKSLARKIKEQAEDEGIEFEDLVVEYLSEAVTLRAWEIMERKSQMRMSHNLPQRNTSSGRNQRNKGGQRGMSQGRYQNIMDDKASFLEYVRNQERNRR